MHIDIVIQANIFLSGTPLCELQRWLSLDRIAWFVDIHGNVHTYFAFSSKHSPTGHIRAVSHYSCCKWHLMRDPCCTVSHRRHTGHTTEFLEMPFIVVQWPPFFPRNWGSISTKMVTSNPISVTSIKVEKPIGEQIRTDRMV